VSQNEKFSSIHEFEQAAADAYIGLASLFQFTDLSA
jgi:hypothetical protein